MYNNKEKSIGLSSRFNLEKKRFSPRYNLEKYMHYFFPSFNLKKKKARIRKLGYKMERS